MFLAIIVAVVVVLLIPDAAFAWGPATHLELGHTIISNTELLAAPLRELLVRFPNDFLYGNISADIVVGKNLVEELKHCHNWKVGFRLLRKAGTDSQKAFALGYLSHLAADTVAHNHFIPEMMIRSFSTRTLRHVYWEMRFDALADRSVWELPKRMVRAIHLDNDRLLDSTIEESPLSFRTNKTIFSSMMSIQRFERWHRMLNLLSNASRWKLAPEVKDKYFNSSLEAALSILILSHKAPCVKKDPTGRHSLNAAKFIRKKLKTNWRRGRDWEEAMHQALSWVKL